MSTLEKAIQIAAVAHAGQIDKAGEPYILHPLRVMQKMTDNESRIVAVLHDVIEDTGVTIYELKAAGFSEPVLGAIWSVTRRRGESYDDFIARAKANAIGRRVKLADLDDNCNLMRLPEVTDEDVRRTVKYGKAISALIT